MGDDRDSDAAFEAALAAALGSDENHEYNSIHDLAAELATDAGPAYSPPVLLPADDQVNQAAILPQSPERLPDLDYYEYDVNTYEEWMEATLRFEPEDTLSAAALEADLHVLGVAIDDVVPDSI